MADSGLVLVTGASGKIGQLACAALRGRGWRVRALVHRGIVRDVDETALGALGDSASLARAVDGVDAVLHLAAVTHARSGDLYREVNAVGTRWLVDAASSRSLDRFVLGSTRAIAEDGGAYSRSKAEAERIVRASGLASTIVRMPEVYGTGGVEGIDKIIAQAQRGQMILLVAADTVRVCPVHVADAVDALVCAIDSPAAVDRTYTLAGDCVLLREFAIACSQTFGTRSRVISVPVAVAKALAAVSRFAPLPVYPDQVHRLLASKPPLSVEAGRDLDFSPRPLLDGLASL